MAPFPVRCTVEAFPKYSSMQTDSGLPWGCLVHPFAPLEGYVTPTSLPSLLRERKPLNSAHKCAQCGGYPTPWSQVFSEYWVCALCRHKNLRERGGPSCAHLADSPPFQFPVFEYTMDVDKDKRPAYVAVVDVNGTEDQIEAIKKGLLASIEAMENVAKFGLVIISKRIGVYFLKSEYPVVKNIGLPSELLRTNISLAELGSADDIFVDVKTHRDTIIKAIESIVPETAGGSAYGSGLQEILAVFGQQEFLSKAGIVAGRFLSFICSPPTCGYGSDFTNTRKVENDDEDPETVAFYDKIGQFAAAHAVSIDVFYLHRVLEATDGSSTPEVIGSSPKDSQVNKLEFIPTISPLISKTSGNLTVYQNDWEALPQDVFKLLNENYAFNCLLRMRTSPEFDINPSNVFGNLMPYQNQKSFFHVAGCNPYKTFAMDFHFVDSTGFDRNEYALDVKPVVQMAFAYSTIEKEEVIISTGKTNIPSDGQNEEGGVEESKNEEEGKPIIETRYSLVQRVRVFSSRYQVANRIFDMYSSATVSVVMPLMVQKVLSLTATVGCTKASSLLKDWCLQCLVKYNIHTKEIRAARAKEAGKPAPLVDMNFSSSRTLHLLPRYVFAMLCSPIFDESLTIEEREEYVLTMRCLNGDSINNRLYPILTSFSDPDTINHARIYLSRDAIITGGAEYVLLNAGTDLILYKTSLENDNDDITEFPPPESTLIRQKLAEFKNSSVHHCPAVRFIHAGDKNADLFNRFLIDDRICPRASSEEEQMEHQLRGTITGLNYVQFIRRVQEATKHVITKNQ